MQETTKMVVPWCRSTNAIAMSNELAIDQGKSQFYIDGLSFGVSPCVHHQAELRIVTAQRNSLCVSRYPSV